MRSRDHIISRIRENLPEKKDYPKDTAFDYPEQLLDSFRENLITQGGAVVERMSRDSLIQDLFPGAIRTLDLRRGYSTPDFPLNELEVALFTAGFGVAENGAIWCSEKMLWKRELPVIAEHVIFVLKKKDIVGNMHSAYERLADLTGYGLFISGPSKTADIEQSLVIGAHGPKSHTVVLID